MGSDVLRHSVHSSMYMWIEINGHAFFHSYVLQCLIMYSLPSANFRFHLLLDKTDDIRFGEMRLNVYLFQYNICLINMQQ